MTTFPQQLKALHSRTPERVAIYLQFSGREDLPVTYDQLLQGANRYTSTLVREGIKPGEVVVLILQHGEDLIYAFWGTILHGAIPSIMPFLTEKLSPERYRADLTTLVSVTKPDAIITYPEFAAEIQTTLSGTDSTCSVITTDQLEQKTDLRFESLAGFSRNPEGIALLQHSSGTTGLQKGVALRTRLSSINSTLMGNPCPSMKMMSLFPGCRFIMIWG